MSGIRFCAECLNILHPEEAKEEQRLLFVCNNCDYHEYVAETQGKKKIMVYSKDLVQKFTETNIDPDHCLDSTIPRESIMCPSCGYHEASYLLNRDPTDKCLKKVYVCARTDRDGRYICKYKYSAVNYLTFKIADGKEEKETLAYREFGEKNTNTIIFLHGNYTSSYIFERLLKKFEQDFRVIAIDLRGFGLSSNAQEITSLYEYASDVYRFCKDLKIDKASIVGWDIGACVGLLIASSKTYSEIIDKLVLVNPIGLSGQTYVRSLSDPNSTEDEFPESANEVERESNIMQLIDIMKHKDIEEYELFLKGVVYTENTPEKNRMISYCKNFIFQRNIIAIAKALIDYNFSTEIEDVQCDTLILCGKQDFRTPYEDAVEIQQKLGDSCKIKTYEHAGHCIMEDEPENFIEQISEFCYKEEEQYEQ